MNLKVNGTGPAPDPDKIDSKQYPMMLLSEISRLMGERIQSDEVNPITQKSGQILLLELAKRDGRTQLDLVAATHLKAPTVSVSLQKLEKDGFVTRKQDEFDGRAMRVFLTDKGHDLDDKLRRSVRAEEARATASLTDEECVQLTKILTKIKTTLMKDPEAYVGE